MPLSKADPSLPCYREHLQVLLAWMVPTEARLRMAIAPPLPIDPIWRAPLLRADLQVLGCTPIDPASADAGLARAQSGCDDAEFLGRSYVIEGAQLGASFLLRKHAAWLPVDARRYLSLDGAQVAQRWQSFIAGLNAALCTEDAIVRACNAASDTFSALLDHLHQCGHRPYETAANLHAG